MSDLRKFLELVDENSESDGVELHDSFDIELNDEFIIETGIIGFMDDGIIIEGDDMMCKLMEINNLLAETVYENYNPEYDDEAGMADNNLETLKRAVQGLDDIIHPGDNLPEWCQEKIAVAKSMLINVWDYMKSEEEAKMNERMVMGQSSDARGGMLEAEYQGRKVPLNKPMAGDVKKSKVYVKKPNGKVVKVNFGDKNMRIKKSNPNRRKSFRARHRCENPGPKWKARYWSCRAW